MDPVAAVAAAAVAAAVAAAATITVPRIGGTTHFVSKQVAWTGGNNLIVRSKAKTMDAFRPTMDYKAMRTSVNICQKALEGERRLDVVDNKSSKITFTSWMTEMKKKLENRGLDTTFRVVKTKGGIQVDTYMLEQWGKVTREVVKEWTTGLRDRTTTTPVPCE
jgi:hypothetical protein